MKKIFILWLLINHFIFSQINFQAGYYLTNSNQKVNCLIKNIDWKNSPKFIEIKPNENEVAQEINLRDIAVFEIYGESKYIKAQVEIDRSSDNVSELNYNREPLLKLETLFLKVIIEGEASLYEYMDKNLKRFFFKVKDEDITQLVYKKYRKNAETIDSNNFFKQQLFTNLTCDKTLEKNVENLSYTRGSLKSIFIAYHDCKNFKYTNFDPKKRAIFHLIPKLGINYSTAYVNNDLAKYLNADFGSKINPRIGIELSYVFPFNNNKWEIFIEPTYNFYQAETTYDYTVFNGFVTNRFDVIAQFQNNHFELPVGVKYHSFINTKSSFYFSFQFNRMIRPNATIRFNRPNGDSLLNSVEYIKLRDDLNLAFGLGFVHDNKYTIALRYYTPTTIFDMSNTKTAFNNLSLTVGYYLF